MDKKKYPLDELKGWTIDKIEYGKDFIQFTLTKPGWYRKKIKVETYDGEEGAVIEVVDSSFGGLPWVILEIGEKLHY